MIALWWFVQDHTRALAAAALVIGIVAAALLTGGTGSPPPEPGPAPGPEAGAGLGPECRRVLVEVRSHIARTPYEDRDEPKVEELGRAAAGVCDPEALRAFTEQVYRPWQEGRVPAEGLGTLVPSAPPENGPPPTPGGKLPPHLGPSS